MDTEERTEEDMEERMEEHTEDIIGHTDFPQNRHRKTANSTRSISSKTSTLPHHFPPGTQPAHTSGCTPTVAVRPLRTTGVRTHIGCAAS